MSDEGSLFTLLIFFESCWVCKACVDFWALHISGARCVGTEPCCTTQTSCHGLRSITPGSYDWRALSSGPTLNATLGGTQPRQRHRPEAPSLVLAQFHHYNDTYFQVIGWIEYCNACLYLVGWSKRTTVSLMPAWYTIKFCLKKKNGGWKNRKARHCVTMQANLWIWGQPCLRGKFQDNQATERPVSKQTL